MRDRLDALRLAFGLLELAGLMQRVTEMTAEYISNRVQFGQPIAKFQAARHHAADILMQAQTHAGPHTTRSGSLREGLFRYRRDLAGEALGGPRLPKRVRVAAPAARRHRRWYRVPAALYTQGVAAWAVRAGDMNEMMGRINGSLDFAGARSAA